MKSSFDIKTLNLIVLVLAIIFLSNLMEHKNLLSQLVAHLENLNLPRKLMYILLPAFIGLLPMPGGALFSAPMVDKAIKDDLSNEEKTYINYWFRHIWEYFLPLYPGVILVSGLFNIPFINFLKYHGIFLIFMLIIGYFVVLRKIKEEEKLKKRVDKREILGVLYSIYPVILIFILVFVFNIKTVISVLLTCILSIFLYKVKFNDVWLFIKKSLKFDMIIMILGIFYFKEALHITGAIDLLPTIFPESNSIAVYLILILLPLISGLLTGITIAYVGISFPILSSYFISGHIINMPLETLAYISGFIGVLLSPVHLCLLLTNEYFKSNLLKVYKYLLISGIPLFISLLIYFFIIKN